MAKQFLWKDKALLGLKEGLDTVADAVRITLGPKGRNVAIDKGYGSPQITNDGVTIAKSITLPNKFGNMGAEIIKEVAQKTNDVAGDGTTTSIVITKALVEAGFNRVVMGANPMGIRRGIEEATGDAVAELKKIAKPIKTDAEVKQVATISAESEDIGTIIANTIKKVGKDGVVTVEESPSFGIESDVVEGLQIDKGYISAYMVTNSERMEAKYKDVSVLLTDKKISAVKEVLPLLEKLAGAGKKDLVIIADEVDGEALTTFVLNKLRGGFNVLAIKAPGYGDKKKEILGDIATVVGATIISDETGVSFDNAELKVLGRADIVSTKDNTVIVGNKRQKKDIEDRVEMLKAQREKSTSKFDKDKLDDRIAKLTGGVAVIRVGAATETEMKYLKLKIEDAVNATRAAIAEGIVVGGGSALIKVAEKLETKFKTSSHAKKSAENTNSAEYSAGYLAVVEALREPLRQIAQNAGKDAGVIISDVIKGGPNAGYDALNDVLIDDMFKEGIIDPVKVTRSALEHASSAVSILLTTEVAITDIPEEKKDKNPGEMDY